MDIDHALRQQNIATMRQSLIDEEILEYSKLIELEQLRDSENPNFVEDVFTIYFDDSPAVISKIDQGLNEGVVLDRTKLGFHLHLLKGTSATVGANKVMKEINEAIQCFSKNDMEGCRAAVDRMKQEYNNLTSRLKAYFEATHQARIAGTSNPPKS